jgi:hypothetical protein
MIRAPLINPLLLFLAAQARLSLPSADAEDPWHGVGALCQGLADSETHADNWRQHWATATRHSFEEARRHGSTLTGPADAQPASVAHWIAQGRAQPLPGVSVLPWAVQGHRYAPALVDQLVQAKQDHRQVWLDVPAHHIESAAHADLIQDGLRLGCAWFLRPPTHGDHQEAYVKALRTWTQHILTDVAFDQWVWPWCDLVVRGLIAYGTTGVAPKRQGAPAGWPSGELKWPQITRDVMTGVCEHWGGEAAAGDVMAGLLLDRETFRTGPLA